MEKKILDQILYQSYEKKPIIDYKLQNQVIKNIQEASNNLNRKHSLTKKVIVLTVIVILSTLSISVYAFVNLLTPSKVADELGFSYLSKAFESENSVLINDSKVEDGYRITLLGYLPSSELLTYEELENKIDSLNNTYIVVAIENIQNGSSSLNSDKYKSFFVTPIIEGLNPIYFNIAAMNGGYYSFVKDGIEYRLIELDDIQIFSKRKIRLAVMSSLFYNPEAFIYNEETGIVSSNSSFEGVNVLFDLPMEKTLGNEDKVRKYMDSIVPNINQNDDNCPNQSVKSEVLLKPTNNIDFAHVEVDTKNMELELINHDGAVIAKKKINQNEYIGTITTIDYGNALLYYLSKNKLWDKNNDGTTNYLTSNIDSVEVRVYDYSFNLVNVIDINKIIDEDIQDMKEIKSFDISQDCLYMLFGTKYGYYLYELESDKTTVLDMGDFISQKDLVTFSFTPNNQIIIDEININKGESKEIGYINIDTLEIIWY